MVDLYYWICPDNNNMLGAQLRAHNFLFLLAFLKSYGRIYCSFFKASRQLPLCWMDFCRRRKKQNSSTHPSVQIWGRMWGQPIDFHFHVNAGKSVSILNSLLFLPPTAFIAKRMERKKEIKTCGLSSEMTTIAAAILTFCGANRYQQTSFFFSELAKYPHLVHVLVVVDSCRFHVHFSFFCFFSLPFSLSRGNSGSLFSFTALRLPFIFPPWFLPTEAVIVMKTMAKKWYENNSKEKELQTQQVLNTDFVSLLFFSCWETIGL